MTCQNGQFLIENVSYFQDAKLAHTNGVEADWQRRALYIGPEVRPFTPSLGVACSVC